jgi:sec-independent protein translocase protein TatC
MITNSDFNFKKNEVGTLELPFSEHIEELRQRIFHIFWVILLLTMVALFEVKFLVKILQLPVNNVKFFQISPGEYFVSTVKISFYTGLLFGSPFAIGQLILFLLPGLKINKSDLTIIIKFIMSLCIGTSFFVLCFNSSSFKFFFKL